MKKSLFHYYFQIFLNFRNSRVFSTNNVVTRAWRFDILACGPRPFLGSDNGFRPVSWKELVRGQQRRKRSRLPALASAAMLVVLFVSPTKTKSANLVFFICFIQFNLSIQTHKSSYSDLELMQQHFIVLSPVTLT